MNSRMSNTFRSCHSTSGLHQKDWQNYQKLALSIWMELFQVDWSQVTDNLPRFNIGCEQNIKSSGVAELKS